ncbi:MAG TPA: TIGR03435 family protein [Bryobacteraceae bacterium]|nr:TIGR03435 family protein [Bryobacteraceae bacterium]
MNRTSSRVKRRMALLLMCLVGTAVTARAQAPASPAFDVVQIKVAEQGEARRCTGGPGTADPTLWRCSAIPLGALISYAYKLQPYEFDPRRCCMLGLDISARVPAGASGDRFRQMIRNLLAERLKLAFHYEKAEKEIFELTKAKSGVKMKPSGAVPPAQDVPPWVAVDSKFGKDGCPVFEAGASGLLPGPSGCYRWVAYNLSMEEIAHTLSAQVGRKVVDATHVAGRFDIDLKWSIDLGWALERAGLEKEAKELPEGPHGPSLPKALRDQLGLELIPKKGMVDVVVVDHVAKAPVEE